MRPAITLVAALAALAGCGDKRPATIDAAGAIDAPVPIDPDALGELYITMYDGSILRIIAS